MVYIKKNEDMQSIRIGKIKILFRAKDFSGITKEKKHWWTQCDCGHQELISETCLRSGSHRRCTKCIAEYRRVGKGFARIQ